MLSSVYLGREQAKASGGGGVEVGVEVAECTQYYMALRTEYMVLNIGYRIGTLYQIYRTDYDTKLSFPSVYHTSHWYIVS